MGCDSLSRIPLRELVGVLPGQPWGRELDALDLVGANRKPLRDSGSREQLCECLFDHFVFFSSILFIILESGDWFNQRAEIEEKSSD